MSELTCVMDGCGRPVLNKSRRLCKRHYARWVRNGDPAGAPPPPPRPECSVDGCSDLVYVLKHGLCQLHYGRWWIHGDSLWSPVGFEERLEARIDRSHGPDACHLWLGPPNSCGYGYIKAPDGRQRPAHAMAWEIATKLHVPSGWHVDHECHNRAVREGACIPGICTHRLCCNPRHLVPRSPTEHAGAAVTKPIQGSRTRASKLTEADVSEILDALAAGEEQASVAPRYGVTPSAISKIKLGKNWKHVA